MSGRGKDLRLTECHRLRLGWTLGASSNGNMSYIQTSEDRCTVVWWSEAQEGATAVRLSLGDQERTAQVDDGFVFVVVDDVPWREPRPDFLELPASEEATGYTAYLRIGPIAESESDPQVSATQRWRDGWVHPWPEITWVHPCPDDED